MSDNPTMDASIETRKVAFPLAHSFGAAAQWTSRQCGRPSTFILACAVIVVWGLSGPYFHFSDTWQLLINTGTSIVTVLMVFLIQNTQNRDMATLHLKLDELIRVSENARNKLLALEDMTEEELEHLRGSFTKLADGTSSAELLHSASDDLAKAGEEIQQAKEKVAAAVEGGT